MAQRKKRGFWLTLKMLRRWKRICEVRMRRIDPIGYWQWQDRTNSW